MVPHLDFGEDWPHGFRFHPTDEEMVHRRRQFASPLTTRPAVPIFGSSVRRSIDDASLQVQRRHDRRRQFLVRAFEGSPTAPICRSDEAFDLQSDGAEGSEEAIQETEIKWGWDEIDTMAFRIKQNSEMDLVSSCKNQLQYFRIKELKDVLTQVGLSKQGKNQELVDRILTIVTDDQVSKMWAKRHSIRKEDVARLVDEIYRKLQIPGATDLATKPQIVPESTPVKPKEEIDDSPQVEMNIRCLCGSSLLTESMIKIKASRSMALHHPLYLIKALALQQLSREQLLLHLWQENKHMYQLLLLLGILMKTCYPSSVA